MAPFTIETISSAPTPKSRAVATVSAVPAWGRGLAFNITFSTLFVD
jgi:hypothetical protein